MNKVEEFIRTRENLNEIVMDFAKKDIKRFFNLDTSVYKEGALDSKTKEMLGLIASLVLRCDDCISYHLNQCHKAGVTSEELEELFSVGLIVGGSIVIPHLRRAISFWQELIR
ncbi:MAG: carboxymuconolactone decarboxylase family protein [Candidatus Cloacimonetes bacterium]|nr:carboxymuconolactone decarboxylase family protein [Candidatus Cloacimonadota bacterium]